MTTGNISSLSGIGGDTRFLQITAPVQPGNSGGPLIGDRAAILGLVVSKLDALKTATLTGDIPQNVNFAINVNVLRSFLDAHDVPYDVSMSEDSFTSSAIAEKAKNFTALIECWK
jgi:S1-C subfamily serine protease